MSRYERLHIELVRLRTRHTVACVIPAVLAAVIVASIVASSGASMAAAPAALATLGVTPLVFHRLWALIFRAYGRSASRARDIAGEIARLQGVVAGVFDRYRGRAKGERFKKAYELSGRTVRDLEEALSVGMYREKREVFVTAFMQKGVAVRVTASIGSPYRCAAADDPRRWKGHVDKLACDEIRQYHNHPVHTGRTEPSATDVRTSGALKAILGEHGAKLRSLIICWNGIREWKVFEHDDQGRYWLQFEFDAARSGEPR